MDNFKNLYIDIASDIHIDQWNNDIENIHPCGKKLHFPYDFDDKKSKILIIAGDVSDDIDLSIEYLNKISDKYDKILFVDGNHEHVKRYPNLFTSDEINKKVTNDKIVYIPKNPYIIDKTIFIGCCGWWDYKSGLEHNYFKNWIKSFKKKENLSFCHNVLNRSIEEYNYIKDLVKKYDNETNIDNIVILTHTVPLDMLVLDEHNTVVNTKFKDIIDNSKKISHWIFGHTHDHIETKYKGIHFICNPRGRPEDFNRKIYKIKSTDIKSNL